MISDILLSWNELTVTMAVWLTCVTTIVTVDFGPEIYREYKARHMLAKVTMELIAKRQEAERKAAELINPDAAVQLGAFQIQPRPARRRHAA